MKKYILSVAILIQVIFLSLGVGVFFLASKNSAPVFADNVSRGEVISQNAPDDLEQLQAAGAEQLDYWSENLSSFDGREFGYITPARNQFQKNTCWAFAAVGAAEASVLRNGIDESATKENLDFDETIAAYNRHSRDGSQDPLLLTTNDKYDYGRWNQGDSAVNAFSIMTQGYTLLPENSFHQSVDTEKIKSKLTQSKYYVKGYVSIPDEKNAIKRAILQYGAVTFNYSSPSSKLYYDPSAASNHTSVIVGWDDDIKSSEFKPKKPNNDGAWIIKNSWGENDGYNKVNGINCYYISYEQPIGGLYSVDVAMREDYQNIYYYDGDVAVSRNKNAGEAQAAIYEAKLSSPTKQEQLKAVMIYTLEDDLNVNVKIYKNLEANPGNVNDKINIPEQNAPAAEVNTHLERSGMQTIDIENPVNLEQGEFFSVVVRCTTKSGVPVAVNCAADSSASINDMTYYLQGGKWISFKNSDYYADSSTGNRTAKIRAITNTVDRETYVGNDLKYARVEISNRLVYYAKDKQLIPEMQVYLDGKLLEYGQDYRIEVCDINSPGMTAIKVCGMGEYTGERTTYFEVAKAKNPPDLPYGTIEAENEVYLKDVPAPAGWKWVDGNKKLELGINRVSLIYIGEDKDFYQNITCEINVDKIIVNPPDPIDISTAEVEIIGDCVYTGGEVIPRVKVVCGGEELLVGVDYSLEFENNILAGLATAIIGGNGRYCGSIRKNFQIMPFDIASASELWLDLTSFVYDGQEKTPEVVAFNGEKPLTKGVDFEVEYKDNILAGCAVAVVKGKGNYTGAKTFNFTIEQAEKPEVDVTTIHSDKKVERLSDIPLPAGFVWCDGDVEIVGNKLTAKAVYKGEDASCYKTTEFNFVIIIEEQIQPNDAGYGNLIWLAIVIPVAVPAVAGVALAIIIGKRKKSGS